MNYRYLNKSLMAIVFMQNLVSTHKSLEEYAHASSSTYGPQIDVHDVHLLYNFFERQIMCDD